METAVRALQRVTTHGTAHCNSHKVVQYGMASHIPAVLVNQAVHCTIQMLFNSTCDLMLYFITPMISRLKVEHGKNMLYA